ncbi:hypothetical protein MN116_005645 [Schistosoma mekongi]|uniref:ISXO2-like transposase domain-containing protein n=1 Tax=Schistosoma mekongi TaxID=38744 RepID=A0AAE1ZBP7_SCHME|nr:hypothetical protein MN116_005645 [Schistosoma mekongi]
MRNRALNKGHCERIRDKLATTLLELVEKHILSRTIIYSDNCKAYEPLSNMGYVHKVVVHKKHFVDPSTGVHTNNIESIWRRVRYHLRPYYGSQGRMLSIHVDEYLHKMHRGIKSAEFENNLHKFLMI